MRSTKTLYKDKHCLVVEKPIGYVCEDGCKNSLISALREEQGIDTYPVHRIDKVAGGALLLALTPGDADRMKNNFKKEYVFVLTESPTEVCGTYRDCIFHDTRTNKSFIVKKQRKGVKEAVLEYKVIAETQGLYLVTANMLTGRTHQIRLQFSSRKTPLYGDRRYGGEGEQTALWSYKLSFISGGKPKNVFSVPDTNIYPWSMFKSELEDLCKIQM